ncbi:TetR/AcrR family transcriptional regulator [Streptomyces sp. NBC_01591]|uniref:TetR/AcrR family transcriptional regulator n=1 Tax=Streptomyces sp. NBC_01591 TaxID=2975888 RepID=UPI002DD87357|nr:TetR/AcrR family transcriptional regulator [Streptomyces sp. NBC_01591]WSD72087.1 TetR/AcrR family transcriptional regulator [Streptomyces sp. NBC_01591]
MSDPNPIIWLRRERGARGPAPTYSRERIAEVAIALADGEGIEAVTMRRIAKELGTGAMTLYRYLPNKEDLYAVAIDQALGFEPQEPTGDARADLTTFARRYRETLRRHPWLAHAMAGRPIMGPNMLRANERDLALLDGRGLSIDDMIHVVNLIRHWVTGANQAETAEREADSRSGSERTAWQERMGPYVTELLATGHFPYLERVVREARHGGRDEQFETGLAMLLDGVEARFPALSGAPGNEPPERR